MQTLDSAITVRKSGPDPGTTGRMVTAWGETKNLQAWVVDPRCNVSQSSLTQRLDRGDSPEMAISAPPVHKGKPARKAVEVGDEFDRLTVKRLWLAQRGGQQAMKAFCECKCGGASEPWVSGLKDGTARSCGCLKAEKSRERTIERNTTHGMSQHPLYRQYCGMIARCKYPSMADYKNYGGRGITVCEEWQHFEGFRDWAVTHGWERGLTIEREDNDGNYCPENCVFATQQVQQNNRRSNTCYTAFGETKTVAQWCRDPRCPVAYMTLRDRIVKLGWDIERAITTPVYDSTD